MRCCETPSLPPDVQRRAKRQKNNAVGESDNSASTAPTAHKTVVRKMDRVEIMDEETESCLRLVSPGESMAACDRDPPPYQFTIP